MHSAIYEITEPGERLVVHIDNHDGEKKLFDATMVLRRREINGRQLARILIRHPFMTAKVAAAIYSQAFKLWRKKVPFFPHPKHERPNRLPLESPEFRTVRAEGQHAA
jgi:DUF1365 family protein